MKLMNDYGLFPLVYRLKRLGVNTLFSARKKGGKPAPISAATRQSLKKYFVDNVCALESLLGLKISVCADF
jgi:hypothetical protein